MSIPFCRTLPAPALGGLLVPNFKNLGSLVSPPMNGLSIYPLFARTLAHGLLGLHSRDAPDDKAHFTEPWQTGAKI